MNIFNSESNGREENCPYWKFTSCFLSNFHKNLGWTSGCFPRKAQDRKWTLEEIQIGAFCGVRCGWPGSAVTGPVDTFKAQQTFIEDLQCKNQERDHEPMKDLELSVTWCEPFLSPAMLVPPALDGWGYWVYHQKQWESLWDQGPIHTSSHGLQWRKQFENLRLRFFSTWEYVVSLMLLPLHSACENHLTVLGHGSWKHLLLVQELKLQTGSPKIVGKLELGHFVGPLQGFKDFVHLVNIMGSMILLAGWAIILTLNRV